MSELSEEPGRYVTPIVRTPPEPGAEVAGPPVTDLLASLHRTAQALERLYVGERHEWRRYVGFAVLVPAAATNQEVDLPRFADGWEVEIERVTFSVSGAVAGIQSILFRDGVNEPNLLFVDTVGTAGASPSRATYSFNPPLRFIGPEFLACFIPASAPVGGNITLHAEGRQRQL